MFNCKIDLDWRKYPDAHVSDFILEIIRPFGIKTKNYNSSITYSDADIKKAIEFLSSFNPPKPNLQLDFISGQEKFQINGQYQNLLN